MATPLALAVSRPATIPPPRRSDPADGPAVVEPTLSRLDNGLAAPLNIP